MLGFRKSEGWRGLQGGAQSSNLQMKNEAQRGQVICLRGTVQEWVGDRLPPEWCW